MLSILSESVFVLAKGKVYSVRILQCGCVARIERGKNLLTDLLPEAANPFMSHLRCEKFEP